MPELFPTFKKYIPNNFWRRPFLWIPILAMLFLIGWMLITSFLYPIQDRNKFERIDRMMTSAVDGLGDLEYEKTKSCGRGGRKYGAGPTSCSIKIIMPRQQGNITTDEVLSVFESADELSLSPYSSTANERYRQYNADDYVCVAEAEDEDYTLRCSSLSSDIF